MVVGQGKGEEVDPWGPQTRCLESSQLLGGICRNGRQHRSIRRLIACKRRRMRARSLCRITILVPFLAYLVAAAGSCAAHLLGRSDTGRAVPFAIPCKPFARYR